MRHDTKDGLISARIVGSKRQAVQTNSVSIHALHTEMQILKHRMHTENDLGKSKSLRLEFVTRQVVKTLDQNAAE